MKMRNVTIKTTTTITERFCFALRLCVVIIGKNNKRGWTHLNTNINTYIYIGKCTLIKGLHTTAREREREREWDKLSGIKSIINEWMMQIIK